MDFDPKKYDSLISVSSQRLADLTRGISISVPTTELSSLAKTAISNIVMPKADISGITQALAEICKVHIGDDFRQSIQATAELSNMIDEITALNADLAQIKERVSQFFFEGNDIIELTAEQKDLLASWSLLTKKQRQIILDLTKSIPDP